MVDMPLNKETKPDRSNYFNFSFFFTPQGVLFFLILVPEMGDAFYIELECESEPPYKMCYFF